MDRWTLTNDKVSSGPVCHDSEERERESKQILARPMSLLLVVDSYKDIHKQRQMYRGYAMGQALVSGQS